MSNHKELLSQLQVSGVRTLPSPGLLYLCMQASTGPQFQRLNAAVAGLLDEFSLISFLPLDVSDEDSITDVMNQVRGWGPAHPKS